MIYIIGFNGFIAKHIYVSLKKQYSDIILLSHNDIDQMNDIKSDDIVINCCGVNRAQTKEEYIHGNYTFLSKLYKYLTNTPYLIHLSSLMVYGFKNLSLEHLSNYQQWFIQSKLAGEKYLINNYDNKNLCIIRPSNVYGYDCKPYYNNLLTTLVYEKVTGFTKVNNLNKNCIRNLISIDGLSNTLTEMLIERKSGIYNVMSNNDVSLDGIVKILYKDIPEHIKIKNEDSNIIDIKNPEILGNNIVIKENFPENISKLESDIRSYYKLLDKIKITKNTYLQQPRGDMVEITSLQSKRLYKITINKNAVRGNHYHYKQVEDFYINRGKVLFLLSLNTSSDVIHLFIGNKDELIKINPLIIHTVCNEFLDNIPELIISSTQEFIAGSTPDTEYVNLI